MTEALRAFEVTAGNFAFDKAGARKTAGEKISLTPEQAKTLKDAGIIK